MIKSNKLIKNLILVGGGVMRKEETHKIDRWMLNRARNKKWVQNPKVLFVPSASGDLEEYIQDFTKRYQNYGARVETLFLVKKTPSQAKIRKSFMEADLIYFGGGDANLLLDTFAKFNLESSCVNAIRNNSIISGLSAGAIIWGNKFLNFDRKGNKFVNFRIENGLGWIDKLIIPHFDLSIFKNQKVLKLLKLNLHADALAIGDGTAAYWENKLSPRFKRQKKSCPGTSSSIKNLIHKYE